MHPDLPFISVMTITYGRPSLLEEAIESFLRQDYEGRKEMVVVNSCPQQQLLCDAPGVRIINWPERPSSLGACRNLCIAHCAGSHVLTLDDDDIILPHYMRMCAQALVSGGWEWVKVGQLVCMVDRKIEYIRAPAMNQLLFARAAWERCGGYPERDCGEDLAFVERLYTEAAGRRESRPWEESGYLYGWGSHGGQVLHASQSSPEAPDRSVTPAQVHHFVQDLMRTGQLPAGQVQLVPRWRHDYKTLLAEWLDRNPRRPPQHADIPESFAGDHQLFDEVAYLIEQHDIQSAIECGARPGATTRALAAMASHAVCLEHSSTEAIERLLSALPPPHLFLVDVRGDGGRALHSALSAILAAKCRPVLVASGIAAPGAPGLHSAGSESSRASFFASMRTEVEAIYGKQGYHCRSAVQVTKGASEGLVITP